MRPPDIATRKDKEGRSLTKKTSPIDHKHDRQIKNRLNNEDTDTTCIGQPGGWEGLKQKEWTIIVVATLVLNKIQTGIESMQVGQGDNVIIVVKIPKKYPSMRDEECVKEFKDDIINRCKTY